MTTPRAQVAGLLLVAMSAVAGCGDSGVADTPDVLTDPDTVSAAAPAQPAGWADELALPELPDLSDDPAVVEVELTARVADLEFEAGLTTPAWTYGGSVPGPLLRANSPLK